MFNDLKIQKTINIKKHVVSIFAIFLFTLFSHLSLANEHIIGNVTIHYNALSTSSIPAEVATQYQLTRSKRTGIVNIAVMKNNKAVIANIFGHGKNLTGQLKELAFKEIKEGDAIYYIASFSFNNAEKINFDLQVQPEKTGKLISLPFKKQLFY